MEQPSYVRLLVITVSCVVCVACSPAQAAAAPAVLPEQTAGSTMLAAQYGRYAGRDSGQEHLASTQLSHSPHVVCEPIRSDGYTPSLVIL